MLLVIVLLEFFFLFFDFVVIGMEDVSNFLGYLD